MARNISHVLLLVWISLQAEAAWQFLNVMRSYLESLCSDLRSHTITNVQSNNDRVSNMNTGLHFNY